MDASSVSHNAASTSRMRNAMATSWMRSTAKWISGVTVPLAWRIDSICLTVTAASARPSANGVGTSIGRIAGPRYVEKIGRIGKPIHIRVRIAAWIFRQETTIALDRYDCGGRCGSHGRAIALFWRLSQNVRQRQKVVGHDFHWSMPIQTA
jgi:hypothetical protein